MAEYITVEASDGSGTFQAYLAMPESGSGSAVVAIQEIFGVNAGMREICDDLAAQGYVAICPDLFWRQEPGVDITDQSEAEWEKAFALFNGFDAKKGIEDIQATINTARALPACTGKVGSVGYCLGGLLAYLTATQTDVDASIGYYGVSIDTKLDEASNVSVPVLLHVAEKDEYVNAEAQAKMHATLDGHPQFTLYDYAGMDHAFARPNGIHWNAEAANLANSRSRDFFKEHLE